MPQLRRRREKDVDVSREGRYTEAMPFSAPPALFRSKLIGMSPQRFSAFLNKHGGAGHAVRSEWTDQHGHTWSFFAWYCRQLAWHPKEHESSHNFRTLLEAWGPSVDRAPELLWAWLAHMNFRGSGATTARADVKAAFVRAGWETGLGLPGDGGWIDGSLSLLESWAAREEAPPNALLWIHRWLAANLLGFPDTRQGLWWPDDRAIPATSPQANQLGPTLPRYQAPHTQAWVPNICVPPLEMEHAFPKVWARMTRLTVHMLRQGGTAQTAQDGFPTGLSYYGDTLRLAHHLNAEAWAAVVDFVRATVLEPTHGFRYGMATDACNLWLTGPRDGLNSEERQAVAAFFNVPPQERQVGEPEGSVLSWSSLRATPALHTWVAAESLDRSVSPSPTRAPRCRF